MEKAERYWQQETEETEYQAHLNDSLEDAEDQADLIREAWDAWQDFNSILHKLIPPAEIVRVWDEIRPWLEREGTATRDRIDELTDKLEEAVNYY